MKTCRDCGLGLKESSGLITCFKYKTSNNPQEDKKGCRYYIETIREEGEALSPMQHLLIKEKNIKSRMMKGGVES